MSVGNSCAQYSEEFRTNGCWSSFPTSSTCGVSGLGDMVWAAFVVTTAGTFNITWTASNSRNIRLGLYQYNNACRLSSGTGPPLGETQIACANAGGGGVDETISVALVPGRYYIVGKSNGNLSTASRLCVWTPTVQVAVTGDCNGFADVCSDATFQISPTGVGSINELRACDVGNTSNPFYFGPPYNPWGPNNSLGCLMYGEHSSTWMRINITTAGDLAFTFGGGGTQSNYYDWAMWKYSPTVCSEIKNGTLAPVRCNWNNTNSGGTGLQTNATLNALGLSAAKKKNYESPLTVAANTQYIICFSNFESVTTNLPLDFSNSTATISCTPLPIKYANFEASLLQNSFVRLNWATLTEINNDYFIVEKSDNGLGFEEISRVDGAGNSLGLINYNITDEKPFLGVNYYRLKQIDFDGKYEYSDIVAVNVTENDSYNIYPNPANNQIIINGLSLDDEVVLVDVTGTIVLKYKSTGSKAIIGVNEISEGIYFVKIIRENRLKIKKISIQH